MVDSVRVAAPRELPDWLLARGRHWVTNAEIETLLAVSPHEASRISGRWHAKALAFSPTRGLQILIPPAYRLWRTVPANQFVDPMMNHLCHRYYVGFLSAAEIHGAAHQRPQVFQVVTDARLRNRQFGRVRIEYFSSAAVATRPTKTVNTQTGTMIVSSVEATVLDLVSHPRNGGGISNVATIIGELLEEKRISIEKLVELSEQYPVATLQRTGYLMDAVAELIGVRTTTERLQKRMVGRETAPLIASQPRRGVIDQRWKVDVNGEVEPDL